MNDASFPYFPVKWCHPCRSKSTY